jgi:hypothetical protein
MSYNEQDLIRYAYWKHPKTGGFYKVLFVATCSTNGERDNKERSIVYSNILIPHNIRYREISEFLDGRFVPTNNLLEVPVTSKDSK